MAWDDGSVVRTRNEYLCSERQRIMVVFRGQSKLLYCLEFRLIIILLQIATLYTNREICDTISALIRLMMAYVRSSAPFHN